MWDVKQKRESLTLNNLGRKAVSAVAWHPEQQTKLITAVPDDTNPVILVWDLKNSNAPERVSNASYVQELLLTQQRFCLATTEAFFRCRGVSKTRTFSCLVERIIGPSAGIRTLGRCSETSLSSRTGPSRLRSILGTPATQQQPHMTARSLLGHCKTPIRLLRTLLRPRMEKTSSARPAMLRHRHSR